MGCDIQVRVQTEDFSVADEYAAIAAQPGCGAVVFFTGLVRQQFDGALTGLELEHYPGMTEQAIQRIADQAAERFGIAALTVIHRVGLLAPQAQIVLVAAASAHRQAAFDACQFLMDYLKNQVPLWKKIHLQQSQSQWVDAKESDALAMQRWQ